MNLSDVANKFIRDVLMNRYDAVIAKKKVEPLDFKTYDFDGAMYHISNVEGVRYIRISLQLNCFGDFHEHGIHEFLKKEYGPLLVATEEGYNVSLMLDISKVPVHYEELVKRISLLKRNCFAPIIEKYLSFRGSATDKLKTAYVHYRYNEVLRLEASNEQTSASFGIVFDNYDDYLLALLFLKEFTDVIRVYQSAPKVIVDTNTPSGDYSQSATENLNSNRIFVTIVLLPHHKHHRVQSNTINMIYYFRYYLHCQIIKAKIHLRSYMRDKMAYFLREAMTAQQNIRAKNIQQLRGFKRYNSEIYP